ncbi:MAG: small subunit ribosomal protein [Thermotogota bacterium]|nr:small subunit ribosomal protein [Thermotogota bacterium]MDK2864070.1 small subunit ribosomal protein [Thermotogota bacterium]HCZ06122.1 30S ribosomal protein S20 [Thermotogota bacterium]
MANTKSAAKRARQAEVRRLRNKSYKTRFKNAVKKVLKAIEVGDVENVERLAKEAIIAIDKAAQKGVIHKNQAARRKSRLMKKVNAFLASVKEETSVDA